MRRTKPHPKKDQQILELKDRLVRANAAIVTDYRGLRVTQITQLRRQLEAARVEYHVAKNTLLRLAAAQAGLPAMDSFLVGPTAVAFSFGDEIAAAKTLVDFARSSKILQLKGGLLGGRVMQAEDVSNLATSPPKTQLFGQVLGAMQGPATTVLGILNGPTRSLLYLLQARAEQLDAQEAS